VQYSNNSPFADPEHPFRKDLETMRFQEEEGDEDADDSTEDADSDTSKEEK
jgi:hypothetical protein